MATHRLDNTKRHGAWDSALAPVIRVQPGDTVIFDVPEASGDQIGPKSGTEAIANLDFGRVNPLIGPVYVESAEPGDALQVDIVSVEHKGWGWNGVIPGFGLLADEFPQPYLHHYRLEGDWCWFSPRIRIPYEPFCGSMGVGPKGQEAVSTISPREHGGNLDTRHLTPGTRVLFPVWNPGALFSCGDTHAAQGDGEVNGTGIESPTVVTVRLELVKGANLPELRFITPQGKRLTAADSGGYYVTTSCGPDLFRNAQQAVRYAIDYLVAEHGMTRDQAYSLCGAVLDLKISQIVDAPNYMVSAYLPLGIFV
jgi:acetamidase/formamidase